MNKYWQSYIQEYVYHLKPCLFFFVLKTYVYQPASQNKIHRKNTKFCVHIQNISIHCWDALQQYRSNPLVMPNFWLIFVKLKCSLALMTFNSVFNFFIISFLYRIDAHQAHIISDHRLQLLRRMCSLGCVNSCVALIYSSIENTYKRTWLNVHMTN